MHVHWTNLRYTQSDNWLQAGHIFFIICRIYSITHDQSIILINKLTAMQLTAYS